MKRFWNEVSLDEGGGVLLDGRTVRTPGRARLALPTAALAEVIAEEWRGVAETLDPRLMPLTGLANAAIDRIAPDPAPFVKDIARYAESDLTCYRAETPAELVARQKAAWNPLLDWARRRYDVHFETTAGVMHVDQPEATLARISDAVATYDPFALAALQTIVGATGTIVGTLALAEGVIDPDALWRAAQIDEDWQIEKWGDDELATRAREAKRADFDAATRFLAALTRR
ncbi:ATP12 family protein [Sphingomonas sp. 3P27F8]|uniref:ATP12 family chaperone protein n=1 Tax=Sphingomonas sp. 3P27F8 TaxID=2502213 RepID=UPI0010F484C1|nr:ATP12 family protein [Sphingomonas sp. 3P27F8]